MRTKKLFHSLLILWGIGVLLGILFSMAISDNMETLLKTYLDLRLQRIPGKEHWIRCLGIHIRNLVLMGIITYIPYAILWLKTYMAGWGFVYGFAVQIFAKSYGYRGILGAILGYIPQNILLLPVLYLASRCIVGIHEKRYARSMWICIWIFSIVAAIIEIKTAPFFIRWCLEGVF